MNFLKKSINEKDWIQTKEKLPENGQIIICRYNDDAYFAKFRIEKMSNGYKYWRFDLLDALNDEINTTSTDCVEYWTFIPKK